MWDVRTGARLRKLFGHVGGVVAVALSPRGDLVASASRDGTARVWRVADGQLVAVMTGTATPSQTSTSARTGHRS